MYRYDSDFDFESANARFNKEDLEEEFKQKLKLDDRKEDRKFPENGSLDSPPEVDVDSIEQFEEGGEQEYYDKGKSFFDNISCETNNSSNR